MPLVPGLVPIAGLAVDPGADVVHPQVDGCRPDRWLYILISDFGFTLIRPMKIVPQIVPPVGLEPSGASRFSSGWLSSSW